MPAPNINTQTQAYVAPSTETETLLCEIWQEVLDVERVGVTDNFFQLGGHSLLAVRLLARCQEHFYIKLSLAEVFKTPTIADLAILIEQNLSDNNALNTTTITAESLDLIDELLAETESEVKTYES